MLINQKNNGTPRKAATHLFVVTFVVFFSPNLWLPLCTRGEKAAVGDDTFLEAAAVFAGVLPTATFDAGSGVLELDRENIGMEMQPYYSP